MLYSQLPRDSLTAYKTLQLLIDLKICISTGISSQNIIDAPFLFFWFFFIWGLDDWILWFQKSSIVLGVARALPRIADDDEYTGHHHYPSQYEAYHHPDDKRFFCFWLAIVDGLAYFITEISCTALSKQVKGVLLTPLVASIKVGILIIDRSHLLISYDGNWKSSYHKNGYYDSYTGFLV